ncbi:hypothetical protein PV08_08620 [Exophiala spinifera]|uniref:Copper-fist domain-containing protein n=1 Tax=Exophiala spinifera TaxID=91928 RepID=A0A0D1ZKS9_9EURO|nr:uncharacterized protein PV08_08620 [Exophiala spinifera]KIW13432.1 hypothetical protein PV08_08620 [Exophiala spinifera]
MQESSGEKVSSPPKTGRVEDGKIRKIRTAHRSETTPIQHFNGKTYACESCKRGHRVNKCDHGRTRPISETNQPGRPSAGQRRGCHCPRNCACTTKTCKCQRDCACTQEMYLVVRVDAPQLISREATSSPKPVWEDANGNKMTLKKVWADANGKELNDEEYQERKRRMREREGGASKTAEASKSSCCGSKKPKEEPQSPEPLSTGGCRHRQNIENQPDSASLAATPAVPSVSVKQSWKAACSCGSACSCLYCPDHPNNATSINHTQQQVKNLAEQAYSEFDGLMPVSFMQGNDSTSCMGGRPTFFLSRTPNVSQQQLEQYFPQSSDPNAIYLRYPISQHSWTNQPASSHCSHVPSPTTVMAMTPDPSESYIEPLPDLSQPSLDYDFLPNNTNGTWDFSGGQFGGSSFSWMDFDASRGTDYNIGQATVASAMDGGIFSVSQALPGQQLPEVSVNMDAMLSPTHLNGLPALTSEQYPSPSTPFDAQNTYIDFTSPLADGRTHQASFARSPSAVPQVQSGPCLFSTQSMNPTPQTTQSLRAPQPQPSAGLAGSHYSIPISWDHFDPVNEDQTSGNLTTAPIATSPQLLSRV